MKSDPDRTTVFVDADNTLWDTDSLYANAQRALLAAVEAAVGLTVRNPDRLAFLREVDQALAEHHHSGLRYPPRLLVLATALALCGMRANAAARAAWRGSQNSSLLEGDVVEIEQRFFADLEKTPEIRPGVSEGLRKLEEMGSLLLIVTEGPKANVERTANRLGLTKFFDRVLEGRKTPEFYRRVLALTRHVRRSFMVGDQLDRDIVPAKAAGLETIYFPGGFRPRWIPDEASVRPDHTISSFAEVPRIISGTSAGAADMVIT